MSEDTSPAVEPELDAAAETAAEESVELVEVVYDGDPVILIGHGPISRGELHVAADVAKGLKGRPDFTTTARPRRPKK
jgi:hypothetical protein